MRAYAEAYRLRPPDIRHDRDGADIGAPRPPVARRGIAAPLTWRLGGPPSPRAKMFAVNIGRGPHVGNGF